MITWYEILLRLVLAAIFGGAIGMERERKDWAAGLRTHMMVSMGSALIMLVSSFGFSDIVGADYTKLDPSRVAAQIVSGIGFIGAGAILFKKPGTVLGLTTASGIWTVSGIGMATGGGMYIAAGIATVLSLLILWGIQPLQKKFSNKFYQKSLTITADPDANPRKIVNILIKENDIDFADLSIIHRKKKLVIAIQLSDSASSHFLKTVDRLKSEPYIREISWNK
ncbi:magnesium transporter MgtC [Flavobacterium album]|uniref:Magnesium transporter MgtC n=1 Tax=Flavobacterium album TaxID=2175091 RepID=A0A2S1QXQ0_9FLAO|nr:MgtC/SapB family protein [Flavobacterium album]AWH85165.1 magnesium transporter MgtC [Flavobacterium album]